jgi:N6-adenosine-specific RNA methylase IME4
MATSATSNTESIQPERQAAWVAKIRVSWAQNLSSIIETGRLLIQAKADLGQHGEWLPLLEGKQLPFSERWAQFLMEIARSDRLLNPNYSSVLPANVHTLVAISKMPEAMFQERLRDGTIHSEMKLRDVTGENRMQMRLADEERVKTLVPVVGKFRTLILDPAWTSGGTTIGMPYATQTQEEIMAMPVQDWLEAEAHVYMWVTNGEMRNGIALFDHWGVEYKSTLTWLKEGKDGQPRIGMGFYFRNGTEHVLFGTRGGLRTKLNAVNIPTWFRGPVGEHSAKPDRFYEIVRDASYGPYGEAHQREARDGFVGLYKPAEQQQYRRAA